MTIHTSQKPLQAAAQALSEALATYKNNDILLILAGGSA